MAVGTRSAILRLRGAARWSSAPGDLDRSRSGKQHGPIRAQCVDDRVLDRRVGRRKGIAGSLPLQIISGVDDQTLADRQVERLEEFVQPRRRAYCPATRAAGFPRSVNDLSLRISSGLNGLFGPTTIKSARSCGISSLVKFRSRTSQPTLLKRDFQLPIPRPRGFKSPVDGSPCPIGERDLGFLAFPEPHQAPS